MSDSIRMLYKYVLCDKDTFRSDHFYYQRGYAVFRMTSWAGCEYSMQWEWEWK